MSKIRPYNYKQDEEAIKQLLLETVRPKDNETQAFIIHAIDEDGVLIGIYGYSFDELFEMFTFNDRSVCGVEEDEDE